MQVLIHNRINEYYSLLLSHFIHISPSAIRLRTHITPKTRRDKWAAPPTQNNPQQRPTPSAASNLETTEQSTVQSDFEAEEDGKMSSILQEELVQEVEEEEPSLLLQMYETENRR